MLGYLDDEDEFLKPPNRWVQSGHTGRRRVKLVAVFKSGVLDGGERHLFSRSSRFSGIAKGGERQPRLSEAGRNDQLRMTG